MVKQIGKKIAKAAKKLKDLEISLERTLSNQNVMDEKEAQELLTKIEAEYKNKRAEAHKTFYSSHVRSLDPKKPKERKKLEKHASACNEYAAWDSLTEKTFNKIIDRHTPKPAEVEVEIPVVKKAVHPLIVAENRFAEALSRLRMAAYYSIYSKQIYDVITHTIRARRWMPTLEATKVLNDTYYVIIGKMSPESYKNTAKRLPGVPSKGSVMLANAIDTLGGLLLAAAVVCALLPFVGVTIAFPLALLFPLGLAAIGIALLSDNSGPQRHITNSTFGLFKAMNSVGKEAENVASNEQVLGYIPAWA